MRYLKEVAAILMVAIWSHASALDADIAAEARNALAAYKKTMPFTTRPAPVSTTKPDLVALKSAVAAGNFASKLSNVTRKRCPNSCSDGLNPDTWFKYNSLSRLDICQSPMILDFALFNSLDNPNTRVSISACTADLDLATVSAASTTTKTTCQHRKVDQTEVTSSLQLEFSGASSMAAVSDVVAVLNQLEAFSISSNSNCNETIKYTYSGESKVAAGIYVGSGLAGQGVIAAVLKNLAVYLQDSDSIPENLAVQLCDGWTGRYSMGIFVSTNADLSAVQLGLQTWKNSSCITMENSVATWQNVTFSVPSALHSNSSTDKKNKKSSATTLTRLSSRGDCSTVQVVSGDSCASLAAECGITPEQFTTFNPSSTECSTLVPGEHVCCSPGTLPDLSPKPGANGDCFPYLVVAGDSCSAIAATNDITIEELESFNADTWGWTGCDNLLAQEYICLSSGFPPMPAAIPNSVCGPQVPGTPTAPPGTDLAQLNQCPLNACCDIWGQCGTTPDFCVPSNSSTGAPGTAAPGQNGCISNCGTDILFSSPPAEVFSIAYFEAFDIERPCLRMSVDQIDTTQYTHVHFSFGTFNPDFSINVDSMVDQLSALAAMTGIKRIISFGGWAFSTDPSTYNIFRDAVSNEANMEILVNNVVAFLDEWNLDGVDFDWEYPDEPDIPGIPAGTTADSAGYFLLLAFMKAALPSKTVSMTAPASFWYLQHFPIQAISEVVDYIVYMTYDLHGQWDYGNTFSDPSCPESACLRSHVNLTETLNALSMITKAGVPSNKIAVGVSSYARTFQMSTAGCWTEDCHFTGPESGAIPGQCTETAGYLADYELGLVIDSDCSAQQLWDDNSYSNILVYDGQTQWAAYMNDTNKATRKLLYQDFSFLGSSDWAVDLQSDDGDGGPSSITSLPAVASTGIGVVSSTENQKFPNQSSTLGHIGPVSSATVTPNFPSQIATGGHIRRGPVITTTLVSVLPQSSLTSENVGVGPVSTASPVILRPTSSPGGKVGSCPSISALVPILPQSIITSGNAGNGPSTSTLEPLLPQSSNTPGNVGSGPSSTVESILPNQTLTSTRI